jgi:ParB-like chromosome segregation protein Spo0J
MIDAPKIEQRSVAELTPYAANSRTHSQEQVAQIAASMKEFGWTNPILISDDNMIIAGHGRIMAAKELGMVDVPVIVLSGLSEAQQKALVIADNKLALNSIWDDELLKMEMADLVASGFNYEAIGFNTQELRELLDDVEEPPKEDDEEKEANYIIQYNIVFDNEAQQAIWFNFIRFLKTKYEDHDTLAERLITFLQENELGQD